MVTTEIEKYRQKKAHKDTIVTVQYSPTGMYLVSADRSGDIIISPEGNPRHAQRISSPYQPLTGVWFCEDEEWLFIGHQDGYLLVYSLPKNKMEAEIQLKPDRPKGYTLSGTSRSVLNWVVLAVCPSGDVNIYAVLEFRDFYTIRHDGFQVANYIHLPGPLVEYTVASPNGQLVFFGDELGYIYRFQLPEMRLQIFAEHHEVVQAVDLDLRTTTKDASTGITALTLSCDGNFLASASREGGVQIWQTEVKRKEDSNLREFQPFAARKPETGWLRGISFLPNSTALAIGADDGTVKVWDYQTKQDIYTTKCPAGVRSLDTSPDGSQLLIGCEDGSVFLVPWDKPYHKKAPEKTPGGWIAKIFDRLKKSKRGHSL